MTGITPETPCRISTGASDEPATSYSDLYSYLSFAIFTIRVCLPCSSNKGNEIVRQDGLLFHIPIVHLQREIDQPRVVSRQEDLQNTEKLKET